MIRTPGEMEFLHSALLRPAARQCLASTLLMIIFSFVWASWLGWPDYYSHTLAGMEFHVCDLSTTYYLQRILFARHEGFEYSSCCLGLTS